MEIVQSEDKFTVSPDGKPSRVTDYKLFFPSDFEQTFGPELSFATNQDYVLTSFSIPFGQINSDIVTLRKRKKAGENLEYAIVWVNDGVNFYRTKTILTGKSGIGFQVIPTQSVNDYLHTHPVNEGEEEASADLFSAFDLWSMGGKGAERYWLVGKNKVWCLVNLYGQRYYYSIKEACIRMANKYDPRKSYDELLSDLIECARNCEYRLYGSDNSTDYFLAS